MPFTVLVFIKKLTDVWIYVETLTNIKSDVYDRFIPDQEKCQYKISNI